MMAQSRKRKLSRAAKKFLEQCAGKRSVSEMLTAAAVDGHLAEEIALTDTYQVRKALLVDLVNLRDQSAILHFWRSWLGRLRLEDPKDVIEIRDELRQVWRAKIPMSSEKILNKWLSWRPPHGLWALYKEVGWIDRTYSVDRYSPFTCSLKGGGFVPDFWSLRAMVIQGVFENWKYFRYCANPDCLTPFFIAKRKDQTVCNAEICKAERQRIHALKWWNDHRSKEALAQKKSDTAFNKKGVAKNVS
jgi:hypothetical protein